MTKLLLPLLFLAGCAANPIRKVRLSPSVDLAQKAVLTCVWLPEPHRELTCMTVEDAELILGEGP